MYIYIYYYKCQFLDFDHVVYFSATLIHHRFGADFILKPSSESKKIKKLRLKPPPNQTPKDSLVANLELP